MLHVRSGTRMNSKPRHVVFVSGKGLGARSRFSGISNTWNQTPGAQLDLRAARQHPSVQITEFPPCARNHLAPGLITNMLWIQQRIFSRDKYYCAMSSDSDDVACDGGNFPTTDPERKALASLFFLSVVLVPNSSQGWEKETRMWSQSRFEEPLDDGKSKVWRPTFVLLLAHILC